MRTIFSRNVIGPSSLHFVLITAAILSLALRSSFLLQKDKDKNGQGQQQSPLNNFAIHYYVLFDF